jgi:hypothetical protein
MGRPCFRPVVFGFLGQPALEKDADGNLLGGQPLDVGQLRRGFLPQRLER